MCLNHYRDEILTEKTCLLYISSISFISLVFVATSWIDRLNYIIEITDQDTKNYCHQWRSSLTDQEIRILRKRQRPLQQQRKEKNCRKKDIQMKQLNNNERENQVSIQGIEVRLLMLKVVNWLYLIREVFCLKEEKLAF